MRDNPGSLEDALVRDAQDQASELGVTAARILADLIRADRFGYPSTFMDLPGVVSFANATRLINDSSVVFGIGLASEHFEAFLAEIAPWEEPCGIPKAARRCQALIDGRVLGWEILGYEATGFHSWLCNGLDRQAIAALGLNIEPGALLPDNATASLAADFCNGPKARGESVLWLPWKLVEYSISPSRDA